MRKVKKTAGFSDLETTEASINTTSHFKEGASVLLKDSDWTAVLFDKPVMVFLSESNTGIDNAKRYGVSSADQLFINYLYHVTVRETNRLLHKALHQKWPG